MTAFWLMWASGVLAGYCIGRAEGWFWAQRESERRFRLQFHREGET